MIHRSSRVVYVGRETLGQTTRWNDWSRIHQSTYLLQYSSFLFALPVPVFRPSFNVALYYVFHYFVQSGRACVCARSVA
jgi:hypothetical protein